VQIYEIHDNIDTGIYTVNIEEDRSKNEFEQNIMQWSLQVGSTASRAGLAVQQKLIDEGCSEP
jgi:hypothetical protein